MGAPPPPPPGVPPSPRRAEDSLLSRGSLGSVDGRILACIRARGEAYAVDVMGDVHEAYPMVASRLKALEKAGRLVSRKVDVRDLPKELVPRRSGLGRRYYRLARPA